MPTRKKTTPKQARENLASPVFFRLRDSMIAQLDSYALDEGFNRSEAARALIVEGLKRHARKRAS